MLKSVESRDTERDKHDLETRVEELTLKTSKYAEVLDNNKQDLLMLKAELKTAMGQQSETQRDFLNLRRKNDELSSQNKVLQDKLERTQEEKYELEEKVAKLNEINNITKADCKHAKESLDLKIQELGAKDREIKY